MTLAELISSFRLEVDDNAKPFLWSGEAVARWFAEAEEEAAIRKRLLPDEAEIPLVDGQRGYPFQKFFEITRASVVYDSSPYTEPCDLGIVSRDAMDGIDRRWRSTTDRPRHLIQEDTRVVLAGAVAGPGTLLLEGLRGPSVPLNADDDEVSPEIASVHHRFLTHWVIHRATGIQDGDTFDPSRSARELAKFEEYFGRRPDADLRKDMRADVAHHNVAILP